MFPCTRLRWITGMASAGQGPLIHTTRISREADCIGLLFSQKGLVVVRILIRQSFDFSARLRCAVGTDLYR